MIKTFLKKTFKIHDGEFKIAIVMQSYIFIVITVLLLVKPTVNALFLSNLGSENLPYAFVMVAVFAILTSFFYNNLVKKYSIKLVAISTIILFSTSFFILSYVVRNSIVTDWVLYVYYLVISLFGVLVTSQFWIIANLVFDLREAKRLFGFIGAGAIAGGILGGYLTTLLADYFGNYLVAIVAGVLLLICVPLILYIWNIRVNGLNEYVKSKRKTTDKEVSNNSFKLIFKTKHLLNLSLLVGVSVLVAKLVDYQFSHFSHLKYTDPDELTSFFGFWFSTFNIVSLLFQLFLTNRLLSRFSLSVNLLMLPLGIAIGSILFLVSPVLWVIILMKGVDSSFKQSINKASFELSILPISFEIKKTAKPFIDVVVDSIATGFAGFLLLFFIKKQEVNDDTVTLLILFFLLVWFYLIYRIRKSYFDSFRENITSSIVKKHKKLAILKNEELTSIINVLETGSEKDIIYILEHLEHLKINIKRTYIVNLFNHPSENVRVAAIRESKKHNDALTLTKIKEILATSKEEIVLFEAMEFLLNHSEGNESSIFSHYLDHIDPYLSNIALVCLAKYSTNNSTLQVKYSLEKRIDSKLNDYNNDKNKVRRADIAELLITIGYYGNEKYYYFIKTYLESEDDDLKMYAIKAAGHTHCECFINDLLNNISHKKFKKPVIEALQEYGEPIVNTLYNKTRNEVFKDETRAEIPKVINMFTTKRAVVLLLNLLKSKNVLVRLNAAEALESIKYENHKIHISEARVKDIYFNECLYFKNTLIAINTLSKKQKEKIEIGENATSEVIEIRKKLLKHLKKQLDDSLKTIFNLLSIKYTEKDMDIAFLGLKNNTKKSRINTLEFLNNMLESDLKEKLIPLLEYQFLELKERKLKLEIIPENEILLALLTERGIVTKILVLNLLISAKYTSKDYIKAVNNITNHTNKKLSKLVKQYLKLS